MKSEDIRSAENSEFFANERKLSDFGQTEHPSQFFGEFTSTFQKFQILDANCDNFANEGLKYKI